MPPEMNPKGLSTASAGEAALKSAFDALKQNGKQSKESLDKLSLALNKLKGESLALKKTEDLLLASMAKVRGETKTVAAGAEAMADILSKSSDIMTEGEQSLYKTRVTMLQAMEKALANSGNVEINRVKLISEERKRVEREHFEANLKSTVALAKVNEFTWSGIAANAKLRGAQAARVAGDVFGASAGTMGGIALAAGGALIALTALMGATAQLSKQSIGAAQAGYQLGDSVVFTGRMFAQEIRRQTSLGGGAMNPITFIDQGKAMELLAVAQKDYVSGLSDVAIGYAKTQAQGESARNQNRMSTIGFVMDMAKVSQVLGISQEEAVHLGTRMGTLTKGGIAATERGFFFLATEAQRLGVPLANLVDTMSMLAQQADYAGQSTARTVSETMGFTEALTKLNSQGLQGFKNLDAEKIDRISKQLVGFVTSMNHNRVMALNMRPGGTFEESVNSVEFGALNVRINALKSAARLMGVGNVSAAKMTSVEALKFGLASGFTGQTGDVAKMGRTLKGVLDTGALNDSSIQKRMNEIQAKSTDDKFNAAKTYGQNLAMGADPLQMIATTLTNILKVIVDVAASPFFTGTDRAEINQISAQVHGRTDEAKRMSNGQNARRSFGRATT